MSQPVSAEEHDETWIELLTLTGEGAYEGLSATLVRVVDAGAINPCEGFIFESEAAADVRPHRAAGRVATPPRRFGVAIKESAAE